MVLRIDRLEVEDAQIGGQSREGIGGDLGIGRGQGGEQGRLAGVWQPDQPDIGDEAELEPQLAIFARFALLGVARCSMGGRREMDVAKPTGCRGDHHPQARATRSAIVAVALVEDAGPGGTVSSSSVPALPRRR
jgi:hypothetical protein